MISLFERLSELELELHDLKNIRIDAEGDMIISNMNQGRYEIVQTYNKQEVIQIYEWLKNIIEVK